ncbi:MAG: carbohydrate-binding protein [Bacteroidales bacterium]|nr:carbohydrate-binding protein [Bacteroidales bacterium]
MRYIIIIIPIFFLFSCTSGYSPEIEYVLQQAGSNRPELERVLKHYGRNPADSLKLKAAGFLIANMPGKYSEYYDAPWNDVATVMLRWTSSSDKRLVMDTYQMDEPVIEHDLTHISAEYLINNIELAFMVWREMPWGKNIPFDIFCEEILPYRVSTEPLENWREKVLASFADFYRTFGEDTSITVVEACNRVNDRLPRFRMDNDFPPMNYTQLMATTRSTCDGMSALTIFVMRGLGIPVTYDFTPKYVELKAGHSWNSVYDSAVHVSFMGTQSNPGEPHQGTDFHIAKIYRHVYANQKNVTTDAVNIPPLLKDVNGMIDVTAEYGKSADIRVPLLNSHLNKTGYAFLAILQGDVWHPVGWGVVTGDSIQFLSAGKNIYYLPVYYNNGVQSPASYPFLLNEDGSCRFIKPDAEKLTIPFNGPHILSAAASYTLKSTDFDKGGLGVSYYDTTPQTTGDTIYRSTGGDSDFQGVDILPDGKSIGYNAAGEWMFYTVEVQDAGNYIIETEVAVNGQGIIHFEVDGVVMKPVTYGSTGGYGSWRWFLLSQPLTLTEGAHKIKFCIDAANFDYRNFRFTYQKERKWETKPFNGPHILSATTPCILKSVDFDKGGQGNAYYDTTPTANHNVSYRIDGGDSNSPDVDIQSDLLGIGYIASDEWLIYTLEVQDAGEYLISAEVACTGASVCHIELNGINVTGPVSIPQTGGWAIWNWFDIQHPVRLSEGTHQIRFYFGTPVSMNLRNLKFTYQ